MNNSNNLWSLYTERSFLNWKVTYSGICASKTKRFIFKNNSLCETVEQATSNNILNKPPPVRDFTSFRVSLQQTAVPKGDLIRIRKKIFRCKVKRRRHKINIFLYFFTILTVCFVVKLIYFTDQLDYLTKHFHLK